MIDVHSHILFGLDDGAETFEQSVEMARAAAAAGTTDIVASPHCNHEFIFFPEIVEAKIADLQAAVGSLIDIHYGCDFHLMIDHIGDAVANPEKYSINHRGYLLVEFSDFLIPKTTAEIFQQMLGAGLRPVVTHPERNPLLAHRLSEIEVWVRMGCLMQVTAASFGGRFGREAQRTAEELMARGLVHVVASDAHDCRHRPPVLTEAYQTITKEYGEDTARALMVHNPEAILAGAPLPAGRMVVKRKPWYKRL